MYVNNFPNLYSKLNPFTQLVFSFIKYKYSVKTAVSTASHGSDICSVRVKMPHSRLLPSKHAATTTRNTLYGELNVFANILMSLRHWSTVQTLRGRGT